MPHSTPPTGPDEASPSTSMKSVGAGAREGWLVKGTIELVEVCEGTGVVLNGHLEPIETPGRKIGGLLYVPPPAVRTPADG